MQERRLEMRGIRRLLLCSAVVLAPIALGADAAQDPPAIRYQENRDYRLKADANTLTWISFMLDHAKWPSHREIAVSRHGYVMCLEWVSQGEAHFGITRLYPNEVQEFFELIENRVNIQALKSQPRGKNDPYYLYVTAGYALPSRMERVTTLYEDARPALASVVARLNELYRRSNVSNVKPPEPDYPDTRVGINTTDNEFLNHLMSVLHLNDMLTIPGPAR